MNKKRAYRLVDIEPDEVSIVTEGANQKRFIIRKSTTDINHTKDGTLSTTEKEQMTTQSTEKPAVEATPAVEAPVAETPVVETAPVVEAPVAETPAPEAPVAETAPEAPSTEAILKSFSDDLLGALKEIRNDFSDLKAKVETLSAPAVEAVAPEAPVAETAPEAPATDSVEKELREEVAKLSSELEAIKASVTKSLSTVPAPSTTQTEVKKSAPNFTWAHDLNSNK